MSATPQGTPLPEEEVGWSEPNYTNAMKFWGESEDDAAYWTKLAAGAQQWGDLSALHQMLATGGLAQLLGYEGIDYTGDSTQLYQAADTASAFHAGANEAATVTGFETEAAEQEYDMNVASDFIDTENTVYIADEATDNSKEIIAAEANARDQNIVTEELADTSGDVIRAGLESNLSSQEAGQEVNKSFVDAIVAESHADVVSRNNQQELITGGYVTDQSNVVSGLIGMASALNQGNIDAANTRNANLEKRKNIFAQGNVDYTKSWLNTAGQLAVNEQDITGKLAHQIVSGVDQRMTQKEQADQKESLVKTKGIAKQDEIKVEYEEMGKYDTQRIADESAAKTTEIEDQTKATSQRIEDETAATTQKFKDQTAAKTTEIEDQTKSTSQRIADESAARVTEIGAEDDSARNKENRAEARSRSLARAF